MPATHAPRIDRALELLLAGHTNAEVAEVLGVDRTTVWRWLQDEEFAARLRELRQASLGSVHRGLAAGALQAVHVLREVLADRQAPASVRVRAALGVLDRVGIDGLAAQHDEERAAEDAELWAWLEGTPERAWGCEEAVRP